MSLFERNGAGKLSICLEMDESRLENAENIWREVVNVLSLLQSPVMLYSSIKQIRRCLASGFVKEIGERCALGTHSKHV